MRRKKFTVTVNSAVITFSVFCIAFIAFFMILVTVTNPKEQALGGIIGFGVFISIFVIAIVHMKFFKVTVDGSRITVRRFMKRRLDFDVSEIIKIDWIESIADFGKHGRKVLVPTQNLKIKTLRGRFAVDTFDDGFVEMRAYLLENVAEDKIFKRDKTPRGLKGA